MDNNQVDRTSKWKRYRSVIIFGICFIIFIIIAVTLSLLLKFVILAPSEPETIVATTVATSPSIATTVSTQKSPMTTTSLTTTTTMTSLKPTTDLQTIALLTILLQSTTVSTSAFATTMASIQQSSKS